MRTLTWSDVERHQRAATFQSTADLRQRQRCQAILLAARGRRHAPSAAAVAVSPRPVHRWLNA
jgi:hypothetical protein